MQRICTSHIPVALVLACVAALSAIEVAARQSVVPSSSHGAHPTLRFDRISRQDGLATMPAFVKAQDKDGFLWVGSWYGLYRYDGYSFDGVWHDPDDPASLGAGWVEDVLIDHANNRWVTTTGSGLNRFDPASSSFVRYRHDPGDANTLSSDDTGQMIEDSRGLLWIGTDHGLNKMDPQTGEVTRYLDDPTRPGSGHGLMGTKIRALHEDDDGTLWVGTGNPFAPGGNAALNRYDRERDVFDAFHVEPDNPTHPLNYVQSITSDDTGRLWVATWAGGLYRFDTATHRFDRELHIGRTSRTYPHGITHVVEQPGTNVLWMSTYGGGVFRYDWHTQSLANYTSDVDDPYTLGDDRAWHLFFDREGMLWVGTHSGLNRTDPSGLLPRIELPGGQGGSEDVWVTDLKQGADGRIWIGTSTMELHSWNPSDDRWTTLSAPAGDCLNWNIPGLAVTPAAEATLWVASSCGLYRYDTAAGRFSRFDFDGTVPRIRSDQPLRMVEDRDGALWVASEPLVRVDPTTGEHEVFPFDPDDPGSMSSNDVDVLMVGVDGTIWVGTNVGLNRFEAGKGSFERLLSTWEVGSQPLSIRSLHEDENSVMWAATDVAGLVWFDHQSGEKGHYTVRDGLHTNTFIDAARDGAGSFWLFSPRGASLLTPTTGAVETYQSVVDGLVELDFSGRATLVTDDGTLYVGGRGGLNAINTADVAQLTATPNVVLTELYVRGERVQPGDGGPLDAPLSRTARVTVPYNKNELTLEYVAVATRNPLATRYRYRLDGVDDQWVEAGSERTARYPNLAPGTYTFGVTASSGSGVFNETVATVTIEIRPPWWRTGWAYGLFAAVAIGMLYGMRRYELNRLEFKNRARLERMEADSLRELDHAKSQFFTNISHEFRTPLTLLLGPVSDAIERGADLPLGQLPVVRRNAERLLRLVNQLLELARLESQSITLRAERAHLVSFLKTVLYSFESLAEQKKIRLLFEADPDRIEVNFERDRLEQVFLNLLANAFRFTDEGGTITLRCRLLDSRTVVVSVQDTGAGIPSSRLPYLFDRFYQVDSTDSRSHEGTGIGLALTKALVELHGGVVSVTSEVGVGSVFDVQLPVVSAAGAAEAPGIEVITQPGTPDADASSTVIGADEEKTGADPDDPDAEALPGRELVLVVEDNEDVRAYVRGHLEEDYQVLEAADGVSGLDVARSSIPDLIVTDVMMPGMDGYALSRALREDERTSHVPIVMLTAKATESDKLEGLDTGVDDYLLKPFSPRELRARVRNLIAQRKRLRQRFGTSTVIRPSEIAATSLDQQFLARVVELVEEHLEDEAFGVSELASGVSLSVSQLNRKLNGLIDQSGGRLIRSMRLQRGADLLRQRAGSVSEIAYRVCFSTPSHFSTAFKKQFDVSPSEYPESGTGD